ncbi:MAG TPA: dATP/dGTP diphosphohydrolase domain-containing protein [Polyangia bacterium]|nr:dATP/dGTP diphosphohydrolase domain-containing protein [Polyangia bacterium]
MPDAVPYIWGDDGDHSPEDVPRGYHGADQSLAHANGGNAETGDSQKKDDGKLRYDLIPPEALEELARVYTIGAAKYADNGWLNEPMRWGRIFRALVGHAFKWWAGESHDQTDGQHHLSSVAWCAFSLMVYEKRGLGDDDRTPDKR